MCKPDCMRLQLKVRFGWVYSLATARDTAMTARYSQSLIRYIFPTFFSVRMVVNYGLIPFAIWHESWHGDLSEIDTRDCILTRILSKPRITIYMLTIYLFAHGSHSICKILLITRVHWVQWCRIGMYDILCHSVVFHAKNYTETRPASNDRLRSTILCNSLSCYLGCGNNIVMVILTNSNALAPVRCGCSIELPEDLTDD